jgi:superfamily II RNA helicase
LNAKRPRRHHRGEREPARARPSHRSDSGEDRDESRAATPPANGPKFRGLTLNPFQIESIAAIEAGKSVLLSAPTGAGKTLVAEYAIEATLKLGRRAIYTAPIKALSNQKYRDFKSQPGVEVGIMTGDVTINPFAPLLIMTTEIFRNTVFESPAEFHDVEYVVFDEIHYMDDLERGTVWEESIIFAPPHIKFICLSATVSNLTQFGDWIGRVRGAPVEIIRHAERPVPLRHYFFFPGFGATRADRATHLPRAPRRRGRGPKFNVLDLLAQSNSFPILFFCFSRKEVERRAKNEQDRNLLDHDEQQRILAHFDEILATFQMQLDPQLRELRFLAERGVAYHHAGLLPLHKELVERLFTSGLLKLLFTTETFALGINMPARAVIFSSLRKFDGVGFDFVKSREYQQMAGRAGRQGLDTEGLVYSVIDDPRLRSIEPVKEVIFGQIEPIRSRFNLSYSTLINLHRTLGSKVFDAWEQSFNNYQWIDMPRKRREKNELKQRQSITDRLAVLREFDYVRGENEVTEKGRLAAVIAGFELPMAELYFSGLLEWLDETELPIVVAALTFEERRGDVFRRMPKHLLGEHRQDAERIVGKIIECEQKHGLLVTTRPPNFNIGAVVHAFAEGATLEQVTELCTASQGDLVRVFRLTIQLMRQLKKAVRDKPEFTLRIERAMDRINRDEVDAKRQLELG